MESSRSSLNLEQTYKDMLGGDVDAYDFIGSALETAWTQAMESFVADGGNAYDWYQGMLRSFPQYKQGLFDVYKTFLDKYGFSEGIQGMSRPSELPPTLSMNTSSPWRTNEAAFLAVAVGLLGIAIFVLKGK